MGNLEAVSAVSGRLTAKPHTQQVMLNWAFWCLSFMASFEYLASCAALAFLMSWPSVPMGMGEPWVPVIMSPVFWCVIDNQC